MIDPIAFNLGTFRVHWYGLIIGLALLAGLLIILKESRRKKIDPEFFLDFIIIGVPAAIICARIYYVIFRWQIYQGNIIQMIAVWEGGLAIHGAIIGGLFVLWIMSRKRKLSFWQSVDILAPAVILGQAMGRWGNFINQEAHGGIVSSEFIEHFPLFIQKQMLINGHYYNPTFLYESIWDLSIFIFLIWYRRKDFYQTGDIFLIYLTFYSIGRFFIEGLRTDSLMLGPIRVAQLISIIIVVISSVLIYWKHRKGTGNVK